MSAGAALVAVLFAASVPGLGGQGQRDSRPLVRDAAVEPAGTAVIAGVVVSADARRQPVRRVTVMLSAGAVSVPRTTVTDDRGRFAFGGLAAGNYSLAARKPAWVTTIYGARGAEDVQGIPVAVVDGQRVDLQFQILPGASVAGVVRTPGGQPAEGVTVQVLRVRSVDGRRQVMPAGSVTQTDDLGAFRLYGLAPGDVVVQARMQSNPAFGSVLRSGGVMRQVTEAEVRWADEQLTARPEAASGAAAPDTGAAVSYSTVYFPGTTFLSDAAVLTLGVGDERLNVDFSLSFVPTASVSGTVFGADGVPAAGVMVVLEAEESEAADVFSLVLGAGRASTRADGTFTLPGVPPGRYSLTARGTPRKGGADGASQGNDNVAEAMAMASALTGMLGGRENSATLWAIESVAVNGQDVGPLALQLREGLTVEGVVVADGGAVPADVSAMRIALAPPPSGDPVTAVLARAVNSFVGTPLEDGTFVVRGLIPGTYRVAVTGRPMRVAGANPTVAPFRDGWVVKSIRWHDQDLADVGAVLAADQPLTGVVVTLTKAPTELTGTVFDARNRPVGAFPIVVFSRDRAFWAAGSRRVVQAQPASDGKYSVIGLPPGDYYLAAVTRLEPGDLANRQFLEDLIPAALAIVLADGETRTQDLKLASGG